MSKYPGKLKAKLELYVVQRELYPHTFMARLYLMNKTIQQ